MAVEKIASLIDGLSKEGKWHEENAEALRKRPRAVKELRAALLRHPDPDVREGCAELLAEFEDTAAVPQLIEALRDTSPHVRFDALSALSRILKADVGWWLNIEAYQSRPAAMHRRVTEWWKRNRRYVWW
jgi:HEAT repeat protein